MAVKKARKQATDRKSAGGTPRKRTSKKASAKKSPGLMSKAKKVVRAVVASGAVQGAVEFGKRAMGLGKGETKASRDQEKAHK